MICREKLLNSLHKCRECCGAGTEAHGRWNSKNGACSTGWHRAPAGSSPEPGQSLPRPGKDECEVCEIRCACAKRQGWSDSCQYKGRNNRNMNVASSGLPGAANSLPARVHRKHLPACHPLYIEQHDCEFTGATHGRRAGCPTPALRTLWQPRAPAQGGWHSGCPPLSLAGSSALLFQARLLPAGLCGAGAEPAVLAFRVCALAGCSLSPSASSAGGPCGSLPARDIL